MCGILGITQLLKESEFSDAARCFSYRGPDAYGQTEQDSVTLGHHRLSILDLDARSDQPMISPDGRLAIVFNGEIYNFKELKKVLASDYDFRTTSDTEVLLAAYLRYGKDLTQYLRGMYAFALHDRQTQQLLLFRDPVGIKPVYYSHVNEVFCFASEAKGVVKLLETQKIQPTLNEEAWNLFWTFGYIPSPLTLVSQIQKLERGQGAIFDLQTKRLELFTAAKRIEEDPVLSPSSLREITEQSVLDHLLADAPVGLFFSGGTDSSLIAAILHKHGVNLKTFSLLMPGNELDKQYIVDIRAQLGLQGELVQFGTAELQTALEQVQERIDEPTADSSIFPTLFLSQAAAKDVKVALSGEGGDELFLGYYHQQGLAKIRRTKVSPVSTLLDQLRLTIHSPYARRAIAKGYIGAQDAAGFYLSQHALLREQTPKELWKLGRTVLEALPCPPTLLDRELPLENDLLRKIDLATSYASIEGRVPLLDPRLIRYAERLTPDQHLSGGVLKHALKQLLATYLPTALVERPKAGFGMHTDLTKGHAGFHKAAHDAWADIKQFHSSSPELEHAIQTRLSEARVGTAVITLRSALRELSLLRG
jgi:asparagine synthase (glutamine-hydrolysing)